MLSITFRIMAAVWASPVVIDDIAKWIEGMTPSIKLGNPLLAKRVSL